jgi:hypothetical protein
MYTGSMYIGLAIFEVNTVGLRARAITFGRRADDGATADGVVIPLIGHRSHTMYPFDN